MTTTTTCERQVCALTDTNERVMRPCIREAGHDGVCRNAAPWYMTAPNPTCASFCDSGHEVGEFADGGGMLCAQVLAAHDENGLYSVEVNQFVGTNDNEDGYQRGPANVYITSGEDFFEPAVARMFAAFVFDAAGIAEQANR